MKDNNIMKKNEIYFKIKHQAFKLINKFRLSFYKLY